MIPVFVTTDSDRRGVFFGYVSDDTDFERVIETGLVSLSGMRNCIWWSRSVGGVFGLTETGPNEECRIGVKMSMTSYLNGVTFISELTPKAVDAWEAAPCVE